MTDFTKVFGSSTVPPSEYGYSAISITADTTLYWPYNYTGSSAVVSRILEVSTGIGLSLLLPPANEVSVGEDVLIINIGANTFTVKDNAGGTITSVPAGTSKFVYVKTNATVAGTWGVFTYGTGTSSADASILAGAGLNASAGTLQTNQPTVNYATSHTVGLTERGSFLNFTGGSGVFTLPAAGTLTSGFWIGVVNNGTGTLTVTPTSPNTVDGAATKALAPGENCIVATDGSNLITLGYGRSSTFVFTQLPVDLTGLSAYTVSSTQAANKLWYFYNTPASNVTVTIPAVASVYYLKADTLGGFNLVFTTGTGATYTLNQNQQAIIFCDGINVVAAQTAAVSASSVAVGDGTVGAPSINWSLEPTTGMYRSAAGHIDFSVLGVRKVSITVNGIEATDLHNVPAGGVSSTTVQAAIDELDTKKEAVVNKDTSGGYAGLTLLKINFKNAANTFISFFTNSNTAARTYTFQDRDGTIADNTDLAGKSNVGNVPVDTHAATSKTTPIDADELPIADSAATFGLKKLTWANLKATLKTYFDTLYVAAGSGSSWIVKNGAYTAVNGDRIAVDTSAGAVSITLPVTPTTGWYVEFTDGAGSLSANALTILRHGSTIMGSASDMTVSTNNMGFGLMYNGTTWRLF